MITVSILSAIVRDDDDKSVIGHKFNIQENNKYSFTVTLIIYALNNCQISTFGGVETLFSSITTKNDIKEVFSQIKQLTVLKFKKSLLFESNESTAHKLLNIFDKNNIIFSNPYKSTNGNDRVMTLVNIDRFLG
jgi:hypothetical protein